MEYLYQSHRARIAAGTALGVVLYLLLFEALGFRAIIVGGLVASFAVGIFPEGDMDKLLESGLVAVFVVVIGLAVVGSVLTLVFGPPEGIDTFVAITFSVGSTIVFAPLLGVGGAIVGIVGRKIGKGQLGITADDQTSF
jgi:hypothetical protein